MVIALSLPLGGRKSKDLNIPTTLSVPPIHLPEIGLYIPSRTYSLPSFTIPTSLDFTVPLFGVAKASARINSNFYCWEGSVYGGNNTADVPMFIAQYEVASKSPFSLLTYELQGKMYKCLKSLQLTI